MTAMIAGLVAFVLCHLIPRSNRVRGWIIGALGGQQRYQIVFSLLALGSLGLIIWGKSIAPFVHVWAPPPVTRIITMAIMLLSLTIGTAMVWPSNLLKLTAHPMLWSVLLWGAGHLLANGDLASILLFGTFVVFCATAMKSLNRRGSRPTGTGATPRQEAALWGLGGVQWAVLIWAHPTLFRMPVWIW